MAKLHTLIVPLFLCSFSGFGQDLPKVISKKELSNVESIYDVDHRYQKKWKYFKLKRPIKATILQHFPSVSCGVTCGSSNTIVVTITGDTIRVLDECNNSPEFYKGLVVEILPPSERGMRCGPGWITQRNEKTGKYEPVDEDKNVLKTTWGKIKPIK